jgi:acetone carboxylase alpha subunit
VYRVVTEYDPETRTHRFDAEATRKAREQCRRERAARAIPVRDWMAAQRQRILESRMAAEVREMYNDVFGFSERSASEFRRFWNLSEDFTFKE